MKVKRRESDVLRSVMELLKARGILFFRRNVTKLPNPRGQWIRFGTPGEADIEAIVRSGHCALCFQLLFIECKSSVGVQSAEQIIFQKVVEDYGCTYLLVRSAAQVEAWLGGE